VCVCVFLSSAGDPVCKRRGMCQNNTDEGTFQLCIYTVSTISRHISTCRIAGGCQLATYKPSLQMYGGRNGKKVACFLMLSHGMQNERGKEENGYYTQRDSMGKDSETCKTLHIDRVIKSQNAGPSHHTIHTCRHPIGPFNRRADTFSCCTRY